ncbi:MAG TPA: hypothetical protein VL986_04700 [Terracidiphilus sp.]|nr:hypothetical protein [Terracidiphilus sp.]
MGREAICACDINGKMAEVKALIEPPELILRGAIKRRIPFSKITRLSADGLQLRFKFGSEEFSLTLGAETAAKWAKAISTPPPSLAKKLGIAPDTRVRIIGKVDDALLQAAISEGQNAARGPADVIIARSNTRAELESAFERSLKLVADGAALWIVYKKGKGHAINEADVRDTGLAAGIVDVKVAAVSPQLTGLKFVRRKNSRTR